MWFRYEVSPKGSCLEVSVTHVAVFKVGLLGADWSVKILTSSVD